jgi:hypothetical protein
MGQGMTHPYRYNGAMKVITPRPRLRASSRNPVRTAKAASHAIFNVLVSANDTAWETDQLMRMPADRFKEHTIDSGAPHSVSLEHPATLKTLEGVPTLLLYESCVGAPNGETVRCGSIRDLRVAGGELVFRFTEEGRFTRELIEEFADRLDITNWEFNRTHWAIKEGGLPVALLRQIERSYDVVLSFAGEDRRYVQRVAACLKRKGVRVFYDGFEEAALWGKDLAEHLDVVYRRAGTYCVLFISAAYKNKMWTRHERRAAYARALRQDSEYILPARIDDTELIGVRPTLGYISLADKRPANLARLILAKLG